MAWGKKREVIQEFIELKEGILQRDEIHFVVNTNEFLTAIQDNPTIKMEKKLEVYDMISKLSNCNEKDRLIYIKKIEKMVK